MLYQKLIFIKNYFTVKSNEYYMAIKLHSKSNVIEFYKNKEWQNVLKLTQTINKKEKNLSI